MRNWQLSLKDTVCVTPELLQKLPTSFYRDKPVDYDSEETVPYWPIDYEPKPNIDKTKTTSEGCKLPKKPVKRLIRAHPSRGGFVVSVHGVRKQRTLTYVGCKIRGCKLRFASVCDWNSHDHQLHRGIKLSCDKCQKEFETPSFLRDHEYEHRGIKYTCEKCGRCFAFKSTFRVHRRTHLQIKIHRCFAGSCGQEYNTCTGTYKCTFSIHLDATFATTHQLKRDYINYII